MMKTRPVNVQFSLCTRTLPPDSERHGSDERRHGSQ